MKRYILLVQSLRKIPISKGQLSEIKRLLGEQTTPVMAWGIGLSIIFATEKSAKEISFSINAAMGDHHQISVFEIGPDYSQFGTDAQNQFLRPLR
jgi:hypothetical protein